MAEEGIIKNLISIKLGDENYILDDQNNNISITPGVLVNNDHYGFSVICDFNGLQKETIYKTQNKICAIIIKNGNLLVFEDGKSEPWVIKKNGTLVKSATDKYSDEKYCAFNVILQNYEEFLNLPILDNPIRIRFPKDLQRRVILDKDGPDLPFYPGVMYDDSHYGFILEIETYEGVNVIKYPTQNAVVAIGSDRKEEDSELKIFEKGKYFPWVFSSCGNLINKSSFNSLSKNDKESLKYLYSEASTKKDDFVHLVSNNPLNESESELLFNNPICLKLSKDNDESVILEYESINTPYPLTPGAVLGGDHYGFIVIADTDYGQTEELFPTENRLAAVEIDDDKLKIYEEGKYHPWLFTKKGLLISKSSYNPYSRKDISYQNKKAKKKTLNIKSLISSEKKEK